MDSSLNRFTKLLECGRALNIGGKSHWVSFKYEKLLMFCYYYGHIVHSRQGCLERPHTHLNS